MEANTVLSAASGQIDIYSYLDLKEYLHSLHNHIRAKLGRYSYQKFSEDLGLGSNNHSYQLIKGHRNMSPSTCLLIAEALKLELKERHYLSTLAAYARSRHPDTRQKIFEKIYTLRSDSLKSPEPKKQLDFFGDWIHAVVFEIIGLPEFSGDPEWIAARMLSPVGPTRIKRSIELLISLGFVEQDEFGKLKKLKNDVDFGSEIEGVGIVKFHQKMMELARESLTRLDEHERDISGLTLSVSEEMAAEIRSLVANFKNFLLFRVGQCKDPSKVIQLNFQLFSLTRKDST
jgi:uncharacterized protein (TIGR02147 family)